MHRLIAQRRWVHAAPQCTLHRASNGVVRVVLGRAERKNALGHQMLTELNKAINGIRSDQQVRVALFVSSVKDCFCAGADLKERAAMTVTEAESFVDRLRETFQRISELEVPTVAALDGVALGGGLELALACDLRYASYKSRLGLPETTLAIIPGAGGTQRLSRLIGVSRAKELIFTGKILDGPEAHHYGLVNGVGESGGEAAERIAQKIARNGPIAVRAAKEAIDTGAHKDMRVGLEVERECYGRVLGSADRLEGLAAFSERRAPIYRGK